MSAAPAGTTRRLAWRAGLTVALLGVLVALLAGPYRFLLGNVAGSTAQAAREAPCLPGQPVDIMDSPHIPPAPAGSVEYSTLPPTSGPHYAFPVATGVYQQPVAEGLTVHAMEHGHVVIQYAPATGDHQVGQLARLARRYGADVLLAPYPPLEHGIALTAWGRIDLLTRYDQRRITDFVEALRDRYQHGWTTDHDCP